MHILHVTPYYAPAYSFGGVVRMVEGLAEAQIKRGHRVTVLTTDALSLTDRIPDTQTQPDNTAIQVIRCRNLLHGLRRFNLSTPLSMQKQATALFTDTHNPVDVVHLHEFRTIEALLISPLAARHSIPIVLSPHGTLTHTTGRSLLKQIWDRLLSPRIANHISQVVALTEDERADVHGLWSSWHRDSAVSVVPNGVSLDAYRNLPDSSAFREKYGLGNAQVVLFMGRLHVRKGVDVLAEGFLQADIPASKLLIVGPDEGMRHTLQALDDERIILTGYLDGADRLAALSSANLFALPATGEGLSMAALEALASGLPVLLSLGCHLPEVATHNAGTIIEPTPETIAAALHNMLRDKANLATMSENAQALIENHFTWERVAAQMDAVYDAVHDN